MTRHRKPIILLLTALSLVIVQGRNAQWSGGTARLLPPGRYEVGLFEPIRYGITGMTEISSHKLSTFLMPVLSLKHAWRSYNGWELTWQQGFIYPTPLLRKLQSPLGMKLGEPDKFALISPEFHIPQMVAIHGGLIASRGLNNGLLLTVKGSVSLALMGGDLDRRTTIDLPLIFPRLSVFYNSWLLRIGSDLLGPLKGKWSYLLDYDLFLMPGGHELYVLEQKGLLIWTRNDRFRFVVGYKLSAGEYPFGVQAHLLPAVDFQWGF